MLEKKFRDLYQKVYIDPVLKLFANTQPLVITLLSGIVGLLVIPALYLKHQYVAVIILLISGYLDTLDGSLARFYNLTSKIGGALDIVTDRIVECSVMLALFLFDPSRGIFCVLMLIANLICITSFLVVAIFVEQSSNKSFFYHDGLMERAEAFAFYIAMILLPQYFIALAVTYCILVFLSAFLHLKFFYFWQKDNA